MCARDGEVREVLVRRMGCLLSLSSPPAVLSVGSSGQPLAGMFWGESIKAVLCLQCVISMMNSQPISSVISSLQPLKK